MTGAPLRFGTAGLRGPMAEGPAGMNVATVRRASHGLAATLRAHGRSGATVVVGRDARHHSAEFADAAAATLAAAGFAVLVLPDPVPTPVVAFAVRRLGAAAGVQITASHNPPADNGYKVYLDGGIQLIPPADREIEAAMAAAPTTVSATPVAPTSTGLVDAYARRVAGLRRVHPGPRVALTAMHGVGGALARRILTAAGVTDLQVVAEQFDPDPDFPTVAFPNPEEPGATDLLLRLAAATDADVAIALDPDADRCAVGIPTAAGWRMLSGDETGWLLGDHLLRGLAPGRAADAVVASSVVSSRLLAGIATHHGARHVETLTGFKWLARADDGVPGELVYAYEEAIGHCVDPVAVRDKDGISAALLVCDLVAGLRAAGATVAGALDALAVRHGVHRGGALSVPADPELLARLRDAPPRRLAGQPVAFTDLADRPGPASADVLLLQGDSVRLAVRPSGTEPKVKAYLEVWLPPLADLDAARARAGAHLERLRADTVALLQRGPN